MASNLIDFRMHKARRDDLSAALSAYITEIEAGGLTLNTPISIGAVLADMARLAGIEPPQAVREWFGLPPK